MPTALYRRYRPDTFDEVIGQDHVTGPLKAALANGRVNHAYLFSGPRGCGKTTSARILARCLNCAEGPTPTPCGHCESCRDLATGGPGSLDVVEIDAASHNGVDDARDLRERAVYAPARDRFKVFILDEAHMVTPQGFNALLKLVEEPPEHVKFIFATTEPEKVIGTIRSRTHHYPFRLVPPEIMGNYLAELCQRESVPVGKGVLPLVVRAGGGSVRDSLSVLDQLMAGANADGIDYHTAVALLGYTPDSLLGDIVDAFSAGDGAAVFRVVDRVVETGQDPRRFVEDLLERFRDLIVLATAPDQAAALLPDEPEDRLARLLQQAQSYGGAELSRAADLLNTGLTQMTGATSPRLQLELICARILLPGGENTRSALLSRLDRMERRIGMAASGSVPGAPARQAAPAPGESPAQGAASGTGEAVPGAAPTSPAAGAQPGAVPSAGGTTADPSGRGGGAGAGGVGPGPRSYDDLDDLADFAAAAESLATEDLQPPRGPSPAPTSPAPQPAPSAPSAQQGGEQPESEGRAQPREPVRQSERSGPPEQGGRPEQGKASPQSERQEAAAQPEPPAPARANEPADTVPGGDEIDAVRRNWTSILDAVGKRSRLARAILSSNAVPLGVQDGVLQLGFNNQGSARGFDRNANDQKLAQAVFDELGLRLRVTIAQVGIDVDAAMASMSDGPATGRASRGGGERPGRGGSDRARGDAPSGAAHRPSQEEIDAVVGKRAMDRDPVDHDKFWQSPPEDGPWAQANGSDNGNGTATGTQDRGASGPASHNPSQQGAGGRQSGTHGGETPAPGQPDDDQEAEPRGRFGSAPQVDTLAQPESVPSHDAARPDDAARGDDATARPAPQAEEASQAEPAPQVDTSAGAGAVDAPALVVPPPADDLEPPYDETYDPTYGEAYDDAHDQAYEREYDQPDLGAGGPGPDIVAPPQRTPQPLDDLDFLGAYADPDISFHGGAHSGGAGSPGGPGGHADGGSTRAQDAPGGNGGRGGDGGGFGGAARYGGQGGGSGSAPNPFADLAARHAKDGPGWSRDDRDRAGRGRAEDGTGATGYESDGPGHGLGGQGHGGYGSAGGNGYGAQHGPTDPGDAYMDMDPENDLDISESGEIGVPVVERLLGGVVIEEVEE